jgi:pilus assembly protein Flp/PilA
VDQDRKEDGVDAIRTFRRLRSDKRGATAIEYGLIVALIGLAMMAGLSTLGGGANGMWGKLDARVSAVM